MTALDVLARALAEVGGGVAWDKMPEVQQTDWLELAEVVAARMLEAEPEPASTERFNAAAVTMHDTLRADELDWEEAARALAVVREGIRAAQNVDANLVRHIYLTGEHGDRELDGLGVVKVLRGRDRKSWDGRAVAQAVVDTQMQKRGYEIPDDPWDVVEWLLDVFPTDRPRVTTLRSLGIDPDAYCMSSPGKPSVQFPSLS